VVTFYRAYIDVAWVKGLARSYIAGHSRSHDNRIFSVNVGLAVGLLHYKELGYRVSVDAGTGKEVVANLVHEHVEARIVGSDNALRQDAESFALFCTLGGEASERLGCYGGPSSGGKIWGKICGRVVLHTVNIVGLKEWDN
jgi:hypothetical protein